MKSLIFLLFSFCLYGVSTENTKEVRIIGGQEARAGQFPFAAAINVQTSNSKFFCGGCLITVKYVLTSGHCVDGGIEFQIIIGTNSLEGNDNYRLELATNDYILHPEYNPDTLEHNLGFLQLRMDVSLIVGYRWIINYLPDLDLEGGDAATAIGWGQTSDDDAGTVNDLNYVELAILTNDECKVTYGNQITDDMVCAVGNYNEGTCIGDSGGPLVQEVRFGQMKIVGVSNFISNNGCESTDPSGFTRIYPHLDWIKNITNRI